MSVWALGSSPCSSEFSADNSPMRREGHSSTSLVSYSWWSVCKSMWRANEQESRARFGLWKEERDRFKILNLRTALYLTLNEQINTISNALGLHAQKPTSFPLGYLFCNHSLIAAWITASHSELAVENSLSFAESESGRQQPRIRTFISMGTKISNRLLISAAQHLILGRTKWVGMEALFPPFWQWDFPYRSTV